MIARSVILVSLSAFFFLTLFPLLTGLYLSFFDRQRALQSCLMIILSFVLVWQLGFLRIRFSQVETIFWSLVSAFVSFGLLSAMYSDEKLDSLLYVLHVGLLLAMTFLVAQTSDDRLINRTALITTVCHSSLVCYSLLFLVFTLSGDEPLYASVIYFGFDNIRFFNQVQLFVLPFLLYYTQSVRFGRLASIMLLSNLLLMFLGGGLGVALMWPILLLLISKLDWRIGLKWFVATFFCYMLATWMIDLKDLVEGRDSGLSVTDGGRIPLWLAAIDQISVKHLMYGSGPGLFAGESARVVLSHPHNSVLEILVEWGAPALAVALVLIFVTVRQIFYYFKSSVSYGLNQAICISWLGGLGYSLVSGVIVMPVAQTLFFLTWGMVLAVTDKERPERLLDKSGEVGVAHASGFNKTEAAVVLSLCLITVCYVVLVGVSFYRLDIMEPAFQGPRFWLNGVRYLSGG